MIITSTSQFLEYYGRVRERTMAVVEAIPPEHIEWRYAASKFSFADLLRHMGAIERYMWAEAVIHRPNSYPGHGRALADGYDEVLAFFHRMHRESLDIFAGLSDEDLQDSCLTPTGSRITIWKWLRALVEHEAHHRGQLYMYLSHLGISAPPMFGLTAEEVFALSTAYRAPEAAPR